MSQRNVYAALTSSNTVLIYLQDIYLIVCDSGFWDGTEENGNIWAGVTSKGEPLEALAYKLAKVVCADAAKRVVNARQGRQRSS